MVAVPLNEFEIPAPPLHAAIPVLFDPKPPTPPAPPVPPPVPPAGLPPRAQLV